MKLFKYSKFIGLLTGAVALLTACEKTDDVDPLGEGGINIVKIIDGGSFEEPGTPLNGVNFVNLSQTTPILTLRRDVVNEAEMNKSQTVTVKVDTALLRIYNDTLIAHGDAPYVVMPASWYTTNPTFTPGGTFEITFAPGELAKSVSITVPNSTLFNPSAAYGFPFTIVSASPEQKISASKSVISLLAAKNQYDGIYTIQSGTVTRYTAPGVPANDALSGTLVGNPDIQLITTGANSVRIPPVSTPGGLFWATGNNSMVSGIDGVTIVVDPVSNQTTATSVQNGTLANLNTFPNDWDPATKTMRLSFRWNPAGLQRDYRMVLKYKGSR